MPGADEEPRTTAEPPVTPARPPVWDAPVVSTRPEVADAPVLPDQAVVEVAVQRDAPVVVVTPVAAPPPTRRGAEAPSLPVPGARAHAAAPAAAGTPAAAAVEPVTRSDAPDRRPGRDPGVAPPSDSGRRPWGPQPSAYPAAAYPQSAYAPQAGPPAGADGARAGAATGAAATAPLASRAPVAPRGRSAEVDPAPPSAPRRSILPGRGAVALGLLGGILGAYVALGFVESSLGTGDQRSTAGREFTLAPAPRSPSGPTDGLTLPPVPYTPGTPGSGPTSTPTLTTTAPTTTTTTTPPTTSTTSTTTSPAPAEVERQALAALQEQSRQDLVRTDLTGRWVPMLASKWVGVTDPLQVTATGSHRFMAADILAEHRRLAGRGSWGGNLVLLRSTDVDRGPTVEGKPVWMTFVNRDFPSAAAVRTWCGQQFPGRTGPALENLCTPWRLERA